MQWLSQYGIWMLLAVGVIFLLNRGGVACGMGNRRQTILRVDRDSQKIRRISA